MRAPEQSESQSNLSWSSNGAVAPLPFSFTI
jgi:hypothetical protein